LFEVEKHIHADVKTRSIHEQRVYGFLAERLTLPFFEYKRQAAGLRIKEVPIVFFRQ
jgi:hypothetical protein